MSVKNIIIAAHIICALIFFHACKKDDESVPTVANTIGTVTNAARDSALADYTTNYLGSAISSTGWTGNVAACAAGYCSQATNTAVLKRINYFRRVTGLNDNCTLDASLFSQEQEAALMMTANNQLNHTPPSNWTCYTTAGANACASSNLALGYSATGAITAFIFDDGAGNDAVGHRRWILHSNKLSFSYGSTDNAMALYVLSNTPNSNVPAFIAYPPKGYIANTLVPTRWSFSIPSASFGSATVTMSGPGSTVIPVSIISSTANGYGDNTLVWTATGIDVTNSSDVSYTITVSNISGAAQTSYTYTTTIFHP
jgi:hypothetical protein